MTARDELATILSKVPHVRALHLELPASIATHAMDGIAEEILAAGYRKPRTITTAEELDALPIGSVVLSEGYTHHANEMPISFQRWTDGAWHRGARTGDTHPDNFLPATVLYEGAES